MPRRPNLVQWIANKERREARAAAAAILNPQPSTSQASANQPVSDSDDEVPLARLSKRARTASESVDEDLLADDSDSDSDYVPPVENDVNESEDEDDLIIDEDAVMNPLVDHGAVQGLLRHQ